MCLAGTTAVRTRSPLRTSLRSLQAVRNSRSFDTDDHQPADSHITDLPSGGQNNKNKNAQMLSWSLTSSGSGFFFVLFLMTDAFSMFSGASPERLGSRLWSPSFSGVSMKPMARLHSLRDPEKRLQRSQSASPCRIPHSAKGHLSISGRVFASPERGTTPAWAMGGHSNQR